MWDRTVVNNLSIPGAIGANGTGSTAYAGTHAPDVVGRIRVDQAWGLFQLSAAAHEVNGSYNTLGAGGVPTNLFEISGHPETKWGGAVMAGLQIKNIPTGPGDDIKVDASYAKGATKYVIATSGTSPSFAMFGDSGFGYQSVGFGATTDVLIEPVLKELAGLSLRAIAAELDRRGIPLAVACPRREARDDEAVTVRAVAVLAPGSMPAVPPISERQEAVTGCGTMTASHCSTVSRSRTGPMVRPIG